jgi:tRNA A-37 threonylcarbamoyl transferase component Bud32
MIPFDIITIKGKILTDIKDIVRKRLGKKVFECIGIARKKTIKAFKVSLENNVFLRVDINYPKERTRLQIVANQIDIEIPKVIFVEREYKFSEWIDGVMLKDVYNLAEVFIKSGDLMGRFNNIKDPITNKFLTNSEFSTTNAIWTDNKKVYLIDHGKMNVSSNPDSSIVQILLKRIREKERILLFLDAYSKYRNIESILSAIEKRNWFWDDTVPFLTDCQKLKY